MKRAYSHGLPTLLVCLCAISQSPQTTFAEPAKWVPDDSLIYVATPSCDDLIESTKKTAAYRMTQDPAVGDAVQPIKELLTKLQGILARELGLDNPKQLEVYPHGAAAFFISQAATPTKDFEPQIALIMDMGEDLSRMQHLVQVVEHKCLEEGARKQTTEFAGTEITTILFKVEDKTDEHQESEVVNEIVAALQGADLGMEEMLIDGIREQLLEAKPPEKFSYAFRETVFTVASDPETIKSVLRRIKSNGENSMAASPAMQLLKEHCNIKANLHIALNIPHLVKTAIDDDGGRKTVQAMGLDKLGPLVATIQVMPSPDLEGRTQAFLEIKDNSKGFGRILMMPNTRTAPPPTIGADTVVFGSVNVSPSTILAEVIDIVSSIEPADGEQMRAGMKVPLEDGSTLDIQKDIVNQFTGPLYGSFSVKKPYGADDLNALLVLAHKSRQACERLIGLIPPGTIMPREMLGGIVYDIPPMFAQGLAAALTDRALVLLGTKGAVESYVRTESRESGGLADDPVFKRIAQEVPKQSCALFYSNSKEIYEAQMSIAKNVPVTDAPPMFAPAGTLLQWQLAQSYTGVKLKNPEALRKYQKAAILTIKTEQQGLRIDGVEMLCEKIK